MKQGEGKYPAARELFIKGVVTVLCKKLIEEGGCRSCMRREL